MGSQPALSHQRTLVAVAPWEIKGIDPAKSGIIFQRMEIVETLTSVDHDGNLIPCLAESWSTSEDGLTWTFTIRKGARYHDKSKVTPQNVADSLNISLGKPGMLRKMPIKSIRAEGDNVVFELSEACAMLASGVAHYTACILAPAAYDNNGDVIRLIATGPFEVTRFELPQKIKLRAFRDYWGSVSQIRTAEYLAVARNETRALMAQSGDADIIFTLDPVTLQRLKRFHRIRVSTTPLPRTIVIKMNCTHTGMNTPELRKALSKGFDRKGIALTVMREEQSAAQQLFPPALGIWHLDSLEQPDPTVGSYKSLMMKQGWKENSEGYLEKDGSLLEFTMTTYSDRPELPVCATALQDQMRKMGIKLNIAVSNSSAIPQGHNEGTLEMGLMARNYGLISDPLGSILMDYAPEGGDWGAMNWNSPVMQKSLAAIQKTTTPEKYAEHVKTVCTILHDEMPTIPVVSYVHSAAYANDIIGFSLDSLERSYRISEMRWDH
ncbi:ABC transporter substrate-binding protein [Halodesulfovibrio aestuarii]|uniref:ABC transporter substrate-binding protein n=1 Tax=Halodesulfovibrio aestuarii TaxID=126333 RepID=UPI003D32C030